MEKSQPIVIIAENQSSVWSGSVELFNAQNIVGGGEYDKTGETEIFTEKYKNQSTLPVQQDSQYGGNPYVQFDIGDDGVTFETGKLVTIKVNGEDKKGVVQEYDDGNGNIIRGFGNPYLFNSTLYQDNGLDYFAFYEGEEEGQYISGTINDGASTFTFKLNGSDVTANVGSNGNWKYEIPDGFTIESLDESFNMKSNLTALDFSHCDLSNVTTMTYMCYGCSSLVSVLFGNRANTRNVTTFDCAFIGCGSLISIDVANIQVDNAQSILLMFEGCSSLVSLDFSNWNTENITNMHGFLYLCSSLESVNFSDWVTDDVTNFGQMFGECPLLTYLDLSSFNTLSTSIDDQMFFNHNANLTIDYKESLWKQSIITHNPDINWNNVE